MVLQGFARRVRKGDFGRRKQVKTGSVQTALGAIGKTIELAGCANPLHKPGTTNYHAAIALQTEAYKRGDPAAEKQVAVPVIIPNHVYLETRRSVDRRSKAIGELVLIAFYFLLRVGEYTHHGKGMRRTQQFRLCDMKFFAVGVEVRLERLKSYQNTVDLVSITIDNQKNGKRGQTLSHHAVRGHRGCCPVKALVARACDMLRDGAAQDTLICAYKDSPELQWQNVRSKDIVQAVKDGLKACRSAIRNLPIDRVGSHSLRAGGAMALFINDKDAMTIQRAGRWTSNTFMEYIHGNLDVTSRGLSQTMAKITPFVNMH